MNPELKKSVEIMALVRGFMTPFAVVLVFMGIFFGRPPRTTAWLAVAIVAVTSAGNYLSGPFAARFPSRAAAIRQARVGFNYAFNLLLIFLLLPVWHPIWLLFLLTIITVGIFENRESVVVHSSIFSVMLFYAAFYLGLLKGSFVGELAMYAGTIWFVGLFVNRLTAVEAGSPAKQS